MCRSDFQGRGWDESIITRALDRAVGEGARKRSLPQIEASMEALDPVSRLTQEASSATLLRTTRVSRRNSGNVPSTPRTSRRGFGWTCGTTPPRPRYLLHARRIQAEVLVHGTVVKTRRKKSSFRAPPSPKRSAWKRARCTFAKRFSADRAAVSARHGPGSRSCMRTAKRLSSCSSGFRRWPAT